MLGAQFQLVENYVRFGPPIPNLSTFDRIRLHALSKQTKEGPVTLLHLQRPEADAVASLQWYFYSIQHSSL